MPEEFKPGCQRPPIKKLSPETAPAAEMDIKEAKQAMVKVGKPTLKPSPELVGNVWKEWKVSQAFDN